MENRDIIIFMSDQHTPMLSELYGGPVRTPHMKEMAHAGHRFDAAYTSCPLCVPARMSFMSGILPSKTGILTNFDTLPGTTPTFAHAFAAAGYETVLIGRMHFVGEDQRHGFQHRLVGDVTPVTWNRPMERLREIRGVYTTTFSEPNCTDVIGGGDSPVLEYDKQVVDAAVQWLSQPHEKPQLIVIGTYGPHFPYVAPWDKYLYYKERVSLPDWYHELPEYLDPPLRQRAEKAEINEEQALQAMAAYCGMIEQTDELLGQVRTAFHNRRASGKKGLLIYTSDHGDQCGERRLYGKMSFFEKAARIPLLMEGDEMEAGAVVDTPVSLMDLGPTICAAAGIAPPPAQDGTDILSNLSADHAVISEALGTAGVYRPGTDSSLTRMVRKGNYKYITRYGYEGYDLLFDLIQDPEEKDNLADKLPLVVAELRAHLAGLPTPEAVVEEQELRARRFTLLQQAEVTPGPQAGELWSANPDYAKTPPTVM